MCFTVEKLRLYDYAATKLGRISLHEAWKAFIYLPAYKNNKVTIIAITVITVYKWLQFYSGVIILKT